MEIFGFYWYHWWQFLLCWMYFIGFFSDFVWIGSMCCLVDGNGEDMDIYGYFTIGWHVLFLVMMKEISIKSFVVTIFGNLCFIVYNSFQPSTAITIFEFTQCIETDRFGSIFLINLVSEITNIWHKVVHKSPQVKDFIR